jgi:hypothetical protein
VKNSNNRNSEHEETVSISPQQKVFHIWTWPLAAAGVVATAMIIVNLIPAPRAGALDENGGDGLNVDQIKEFVAVESGEKSRKNIKLPISTGKMSLAQITKSIRESGKLPSRQDVRIEEMLNSFSLETKGSVALWKGNSLGAEVIKCPWSPSGSLVFVKIRGALDRSSSLSIEFQGNENSVILSRLLGYELEKNDRERKPMPEQMAAGQESLVALFVEAKSHELGKLVWTVDGVAAPSVDLIRDTEKEASSDSQFAAFVCGFGFWLREEKPGIIDDALILGLAREVAAESLVADRYDFLELVDQAVKVKGK